MAHGNAKVEGKPLAVLAHGTVGVQHAAMAIYNAYCDRVPIFTFGSPACASYASPALDTTNLAPERVLRVVQHR
jgi:acetolactate synthase-1/2/3 large subunit